MTAIDDLKNKVTRLRDELQDAETKLINAVRETAPFKVGDVWVDNRRRQGKITRILVSYNFKPEAHLTLYKKDGSLGVREIPAFSWDGWKPLP
jgi:hypothetical protein